MSRTQRSIVSFVSSLLLQAVTLAIGVVSTPLLLRWLGDDRFGAFRSVTDWAGHLRFFELGLGGALMPLFAIALGQGDRLKVQQTIAVGIRAYLKVVSFMLVAASVLGYVILQLVPVQKSLEVELQTAYWLGLLTIALLPLNPFRLVAEASQRSDIVNLSFIFQSLIITGLSLYSAHQGMGLPGQALSTVIGVSISTLFVSWKIYCRYPDVLAMVFRTSAQVRQSIRGQLHQLSTPTLIVSIAGQIGLLTDNLVIAYFLGPASVVPFIMTQRLIGVAQGQVQAIGNATWSALAELYAKNEIDQFNLRLIQLTKLVAISGLVLMIPILIYNSQFVQLWVGAERFAGLAVSILAGVNAVMQGIFSLWGWCFSGTGNVGKIARFYTFGALINILIGLTATPVFHLIGPLLGTSISFFLVYLWGMLHHLHQLFGVSQRALLQAIVRPFLLASLYAPVAAWIASLYPPQGWIELGISMALTATLFVVAVWFTLLESEEREQLSRRFRRSTRFRHS